MGECLRLFPRCSVDSNIICRFKGTDDTFGPFPERLQHVLSESVSNLKVECMVFPAYEVRGGFLIR
jgi:hypothetical protein